MTLSSSLAHKLCKTKWKEYVPISAHGAGRWLFTPLWAVKASGTSSSYCAVIILWFCGRCTVDGKVTTGNISTWFC